ncbi:MAG: stage II sporulation protein P [Caldibacillus debilis]|uniref:Stage II sporulation protein P n=1 Tax=Caldibacillus debilis TaxID=301148 RepID=A0A3E0K3S4_9BACI|nr:stage II sporulation protein P [Caldibacillus debilis]REJ27861.1 MAG: stage II sporulation protein P [Caldibacillus debilis]
MWKGFSYRSLLVFIVASIFAQVLLNRSSLFFGSFFQEPGKGAVETENLMRIVASENLYFYPSLLEENQFLFSNALKLAVNINLKDVRSFIFHEIPGLYAMSSEIVVAGDGTDFTNLPIESGPPLEELLREREVAEESLDQVDEGKENGDGREEKKQPEKYTVFIFHTHSRESFIPHLKNSKDAQSAQHKEVNITLVGKRFGEKLNEKGIGAMVDTTDIPTLLQKKHWEYWQSYDASRGIVQEAMAKNKELAYFFDIHRDSAKRNATTTKINGKTYAKIFFVLGQGNPHYKENEEFALKLNDMIKKKYPSLTRGIVRKPKTAGTNGVYNQDLASHALVIEIGGIENTLDEMYNTADVLADIFAEYYWQDAVETSG